MRKFVGPIDKQPSSSIATMLAGLVIVSMAPPDRTQYSPWPLDRLPAPGYILIRHNLACARLPTQPTLILARLAQVAQYLLSRIDRAQEN